jgi:hypothetical protein
MMAESVGTSWLYSREPDMGRETWTMMVAAYIQNPIQSQSHCAEIHYFYTCVSFYTMMISSSNTTKLRPTDCMKKHTLTQLSTAGSWGLIHRAA